MALRLTGGCASPASGGTGLPAAGEHFWKRSTAAWHLVFAAFLVVSATVVFLDAGVADRQRWWAIAMLAVWAIWYAVLGLPSLRQREGSPQGVTYAAGAVVLCVAVLSLDSDLDLLLYVTTPQLFMFSGRMRYAAPLVVALFGGFGAVLLSKGALDESTVTRLVGSVVFACLLGAFISGISQQSLRRAQLIAELEATREQLASVSHERGVLAERARLSREIHDTLAQGFTSVVMLLEAAEAKVRDDPDGAGRMLELARQAARDNLAEARAIVATLAPAGHTEGALPETLRRLVDGFGRELGLTATVTVDGVPGPLAAAHEVVLLRCCQEALANVRKHAAATLVEVRLDYLEGPTGGTRLTVRDNGRGFDPAHADGFGLHGMRDRVADVGGIVRVSSTVGSGTTVEVVLP